MEQNTQYAERLLHQLGPEQLTAVVQLLQVMVDPISRSLANAPVEDEEITPEMAAELDAARASTEEDEGVSHQEILREFGLLRR